MSEQDAPPTDTTRINPRWLAKTMVFLIVALGLGAWFALDAMVVYPKRGRAVVEFQLLDYLEQSQQSTQLFTASVPQPKTTYDALLAKGKDTLSGVEKARFDWLDALSRVESLSRIEAFNAANPDTDSQTMFPDPRNKLGELKTALAGRSQPKPLSTYDIPTQYAMLALCVFVVIWILVMLAKVMGTKFRYDHATSTLTLPGGKTITAEELELLDKRKWDKFYAFLKVKGRPDEVKLDLYRYVPLEEWVLDMWRRSPNYDPAGDDHQNDDNAKGDDVDDADVMSSTDLPAM